MPSEDETLRQLMTCMTEQFARLREYDAYYEGEQAAELHASGADPAAGGPGPPGRLNWPQLIVDSVEERLNIEGFRRPDQPSGDKDLWEIWEDNDMDAGSQRAHVEPWRSVGSYVTVGSR